MKTKITIFLMFCLATVTSFGQTCVDISTVVIPVWGGQVELYGADFVLDPIAGETYTISPNLVDCDDIGTFTGVITGPNSFTCTVEITLVDAIPPIAVSSQSIYVSLDENGVAVITPDLIDNGSYDECSDVELELSKTTFTCSDIGAQNVILTVTDSSGNYNSVISEVIIEDKLRPIPYALNDVIISLSSSTTSPFPHARLYPESIDAGSTDNCGIEGYILSQEFFTCEDLGTQEVTLTVYDFFGNFDDAVVNVEVVFNGEVVSALSCNDGMVLSAFTDLPKTIQAEDVLEGGPYACGSTFLIEILDESGSVITGNTITSDYIGQLLTYTITDVATQNQCWGSIEVVNTDEDCFFDPEVNNPWPLEVIDLNVGDFEGEELTPDFLISQFGFAEEDVLPTLPTECELLAYTYEDVYFYAGDELDRVWRVFTVINWLAFEPGSTEGVYYFSQTINNTNSPLLYICDDLPRSAPVGDCESGHTLLDDVEWPNDIAISDHRLLPSELISFSGIDSLDASPSFYGSSSDLYSAGYQDLVNSLTATELEINRQWTVTRSGTGAIWQYEQLVTVDFSTFSSLVAVNTLANRGVPNVDLTGAVLTNDVGVAYIEDEVNLNPQLTDDPLNGLDIVDLIMMRRHILGAESLDEYQQLAADINGNGAVTTLDLVLLHRIILGDDEGTDQWNFIDITEESSAAIQPKAHYVAIKSGDVNDSATLDGQSANTPNQSMTFEDVLLNQGESYTVPFYSASMIEARGVEIRLKYDATLLEIDAVVSDLFSTDMEWTIDEQAGVLTIITFDAEDTHLLDGSDALFEISATAKENSILHLALDFDPGLRSVIVDADFNKFGINGNVSNSIDTGTNNEDLVAGISIYPNPAVDFITVDIIDTQITSDYTVTLFSLDGRQLTTVSNTPQLDVTMMNSGTYLLYLSTGDSYYSQLVTIQK